MSVWRRLLSFATRPRPQFPYGTGQPIHETRPHLINPGDITPGISAEEYYQRRVRLAHKLPPSSVAIVSGSSVQFASGLVFHPFQQNTDLFYLSGWNEPDTVIAVEVDANHEMTFHMVVPPKNPHKDKWEGDKSGLEGAYDVFNADIVVDSHQGKRHLTELVDKAQHVFIDSTKPQLASLGLSSALNQLSGRLGAKPVAPIIAKLRAIKLALEQRVMAAAAKASSRAIHHAIATSTNTPFRQEKTLARFLDYSFVLHGCDGPAYIPVVALGANALTIHYTRNDDVIYDDELVFIDAGGKLGGYCADISRAWPHRGKFSEPQKDLYSVVLECNKQCIDHCVPLNSLHDIHEVSVLLLLKGLQQLPGFSHVLRTEVARSLYPHYIGHHLGIDLHDVPLVLRFDPLQPGNVVTIEPGLYIPKDDKWPKHYQGIGIRVEDDVVVGSSLATITNLTAGCVKEIADIEALIANGVTTPGVGEEQLNLL